MHLCQGQYLPAGLHPSADLFESLCQGTPLPGSQGIHRENQKLNEKGVSVFILQNGLETLLPDGKVNPIASLVLGIMSQFNSMERDLIRARMKNGYDNLRAQHPGEKVVGRKVGYRKTNYADEYAKEISLLKKNVSLRDCQSLTGTSINTLRKLKSMFVS